MFLGALATEVKARGLLSSPSRATAVFQAVTGRTGTNSEPELGTMIRIGSMFPDAYPHGIAFSTIPASPATPTPTGWSGMPSRPSGCSPQSGRGGP
ncbi:hypothetical protein CDO52_07060 [Nocardiopsis gilva YIM 90087]|uniref:Uncharacterized protein n=1 Tax=Nocardiopsis gilva YIM 90087 TaxID=1235441 RepID=A0A223S377_9ACTN|nr:hypothetical protein [Nocardiopsis gilva]ASU82575.1 hypothetical protein CDO52_07060 [Nocardiopsis gilva YIM 90087]